MWADGTEFEGTWTEDDPCRVKKQIYENGDEYEGPFDYMGRRHGQEGTMRYTNGDVYEGTWF